MYYIYVQEVVTYYIKWVITFQTHSIKQILRNQTWKTSIYKQGQAVQKSETTDKQKKIYHAHNLNKK